MTDEEVPFTGGRTTAGVVKVADTVRRPQRTKGSLRNDLLHHLHGSGFAGAPRFLGTDDQSRDIFEFIPGDVPSDLGFFDDAQLAAAARLLRTFHDATASFGSVVQSGLEVVCHNDWTPTNAVFRNGLPIALIDFDTLAPGMRLWDLGYSAFTWLELGNPDYTGAEQIRRLKVFTGAYGHGDCRPEQIAVNALARMTCLAVSAQMSGNSDLETWARQCAAWTAEHVLELLLPTRQFPPQASGLNAAT